MITRTMSLRYRELLRTTSPSNENSRTTARRWCSPYRSKVSGGANRYILALGMFLLFWVVGLGVLPAREAAAQVREINLVRDHKVFLQSQQDPTWNDWVVGQDSAGRLKTIGQCGCFLATLSTAMNTVLKGSSTPWYGVPLDPDPGFPYDSNSPFRSGFWHSGEVFTPPYLASYLTYGRTPYLGDEEGRPKYWGYLQKGAFNGCGEAPRTFGLAEAGEPEILAGGPGFLVRGSPGVMLNYWPGLSGEVIDQSLSKGWPVIVGIDATRPPGRPTGHMQLIVGKTLDGRYLVSDPNQDSLSAAYVPGPGFPNFSYMPKTYGEWLAKVEETIAVFPSTDVPGELWHGIKVEDDPAAFEFLAISPDGRKTGFDPATQTDIKEDPSVSNYEVGAWHDPSGHIPPGDPVKALEVAYPTDGTYRIQVTGTGDGPAKFSLSTVVGHRETVLKEVDRTIANGQHLKYELEYSKAGESSVSEVVNFTPEARPEADSEVLAGDALGFDGSNSFDADGIVESYEWDFGDGGTASGSEASHTYVKPGTYTVTLKVTDDQGATDTSTAMVKVKPTETISPSTTATLSPEPNANGWNNTALTVNLRADDGAEGSGVEGITYSATGTHEIAQKTVDGASVQVPITAEGETRISYSAKDKMDNAEEQKTLTVRLDKTEPAVGSTSPTDGATGTDPTANVTVEFSDAMDASTIKSDTFTLVRQGDTMPVKAAIIYDDETKKATLDPDADLSPEETYTVTVRGGSGGVKDKASNTLAVDKTWRFTTTTRSTQERNAAFSWGTNGVGQLGDGTYEQRGAPVRVKGLIDVEDVAAGYFHGLAVQNNGAPWAWGGNTSGQLGTGGTSAHSTLVRVNGLADVEDVAAGEEHSLALKSTGTVWAWGGNASGQLGDGTWQQRTAPVRVDGLAGVEAVATGFRHSLAVRNDGTVWAWGTGGFGQLGNGSYTERQSAPTQVSGLSDVKDVAAGVRHSLAVKNDGTVWAWGNNLHGELGVGYTGGDSTRPVQVSGLADVKAVAAGNNYSLAVKNDGTVWAWGENSSGELGTGGTISRSGAPMRVGGLTDVKDVSALAYHSLAVENSGEVWAWGENWGYRPLQVKEPSAPDGVFTGVKEVAAGAGYSLAVKPDATPLDARPPDISLPANITKEATSSDGVSVTFAATATDEDPANPPVTCSPASGSTFLIGETTVNCSAIDAAGNKANGSFKVIVSDTTAPTTDVTQGPDGWINQNTASFGWTGSDAVTPTAHLVYSHKLDSGTWSTPYSAGTSVTLENLGEGEHTFYVRAKDAAGNEQGEAAQRTFSVDTIAPSIQDGGHTPEQPNSSGWYNVPVTNTFFASDGDGSGLAEPDKAIFQVTSEGEGAAVTIASRPVSDVAGNVAQGIKAEPFRIDLTDPVVDITNAPAEGATVALCDRILAPSFTAEDALSGIATTNAPGVLTKPTTDSGVGTYSYEAKATDKAENSLSITRTYRVAYDAAYGGVLQPVSLGDQRSVFKVGSTVPVKFKLMCGTQPITDAVARLSVQKVDGTVEGPVNEVVSTSAATMGNLFRYDDTNQQYIFNLSTKGSFDGGMWSFSEGTWRLVIELDDGSRHHALIDLGS